jgi:GGDEF domain-containing protein
LVIVAYISYQILYFPYASEVDYFSFFAEGTIALLVLASTIVLQRIKDVKIVFIYLGFGFAILLISLLTDTLDEIFVHPKLLTTLLEDARQVLGFAFISAGIYKWIIINRTDQALYNAKQSGRNCVRKYSSIYQ